jgi:hypothetical protein
MPFIIILIQTFANSRNTCNFQIASIQTEGIVNRPKIMGSKSCPFVIHTKHTVHNRPSKLFKENKGNNKIAEQSYKGKVKTHKYINRQNQSTTGKL